MPTNLSGLTVVVTRPRHQAGEFQRLLQAAGAKCILFPLIAIEPIAGTLAADAVAKLMKLYTYDTVLFISANAVDYSLALLDVSQRQQLAQLTIGAIGKKTAQLLQAQGLAVSLVPPAGFTSEAFLALPAVQDLAERRILIIRGVGGRELLAQTLRARGASVDYCEVYQRFAAESEPALLNQHYQQGQLDIIAITSIEGLKQLMATFAQSDWITTIPLLLGNKRIAEQARELGFTGELVIASDPSDQAMLDALVQWSQEQD